MRRLRISILAASIFAFTNGCVEMQRICSSQEMIAMKEKGFSVDQIDNMCTAYKVKEESVQAVADVVKVMATNPRERSNPATTGNANQQAMPAFANAGTSAAYCTTPYGSCPLGTRAPTGVRCHCQTFLGPIGGETR